MGIGTTKVADASYKLFVETGIRTRKVKVDIDAWSDYVFEPGYKLHSLNSVEAFINKNNHLPDVPSEKEVKKGGLDIGVGQAILLRKIEELTLYVIEQDKKSKQHEKKIQAMSNKIGKLKKLILSSK